MRWSRSKLQGKLNAWLLKVGKVQGTLVITGISVVLSVLMTWVANAAFMPNVPLEEWLYISIVAPALISPPICSVVLSLLYELGEAKAALLVLSETDALTGVGNRRQFMNRARQAAYEAAALQTPLTIVLIDIDHFKQVNDTFGHSGGDDVLVMVANVCRRALRHDDVFCRWGGEEFIALFPSTTLGTGLMLAERLRAEVAGVRALGGATSVTISLGVVELSGSCKSIDQAIEHADRLLYLAKQSGRNRVEPRTPSGVGMLA